MKKKNYLAQKYIEKTSKIEQCKKLRDKMLTESAKKLKDEKMELKKRQVEELEKNKQKNEQEAASYAQCIETNARKSLEVLTVFFILTQRYRIEHEKYK